MSTLKRAVPVGLFGVGALTLAWGASRVAGPAVETSRPPVSVETPSGPAEPTDDETDETPDPDPILEVEPGPDPNVARVVDGEIVEAPTAEDYRCLVPR